MKTRITGLLSTLLGNNPINPAEKDENSPKEGGNYLLGSLFGRASSEDEGPASPKPIFQAPTRPGQIYQSDIESKELAIYVLGCQDDGVEAQKQVALLMNTISKNNLRKPDLLIFSGDNFKARGTDNPNDPIFDTNFHSIYQHPELKMINETPCLVALGNHDVDAGSGTTQSQKAQAQVDHTFFNLKTSEPDQDKIRLFQADEKQNELKVSLSDLRKLSNKWIMPSRYYAFRLGTQVEIVVIDSNTLVKDYITYSKGDRAPTNQFAWLSNHAKTSETPLKLLVMHHPPITIDKRIHRSDANDYLTPGDIEFLASKNILGNYNQFLYSILHQTEEAPGKAFRTVISAHQHAQHLLQEEKQWHLVSGGAGGPLQNRYCFKSHERVATFIKDHGFTCIELSTIKNEERIAFKMYSISGLELHFSDSLHPDIEKMDDDFAKLRELVLEGCKAFQIYLSTNPPKPWNIYRVYDSVPEDVMASDSLRNQFNKHYPMSMKESFDFLQGLFSQLISYPKWREIFDRLLKKTYKCSYDEFIMLSFANFLNNKEKTIELSFSPNRSAPISIPGRTSESLHAADPHLDFAESEFTPSPTLGGIPAAFFKISPNTNYFSPSHNLGAIVNEITARS